MKKLTQIAAVVLGMFLLAGCTSTERGAVVGGVAGGAIGAATTGTAGGAVVGAAGGALAGALIGRVAGNRCRYSDGRGGSYIGRC
ncbi:MAG: glycine zipper domain-containing protein [Pseudomonadota bacterium]